LITVDYAFYTGTYKGTLSEADFNRLAIKASAYLDRVTHDRLAAVVDTAVLELAKLACCSAADAMLANEQGGVKAESNDGVSVTYVEGSGPAKADGKRLREAVGLFLGGTDLLFRGVDYDADV